MTIVYSGLLLATEELAMYFAERAYGGILNLYVEYDERVLTEYLRDLTTFQMSFVSGRLGTRLQENPQLIL